MLLGSVHEQRKYVARLEAVERLGTLGALVLDHLERVEAHRLGERAALASHDNVTNLNTERGRDVHRQVPVAPLVTVVLVHVVQVLPADDDGTGHLGRNDLAAEETATDRHETGPGALLVCNESAGMSHGEHAANIPI